MGSSPQPDMRTILAGSGVAALLVVTVALAGLAKTAHADIYKYRNKDGTILVTTHPRSGLKLVEVIRDGSTTAPEAGKRKVSPRHAKLAEKAKKKAAVAKANSGLSRGEAHYDQIIREASQTYQIPFAFIKGVIKVESNFNPYAVSRTGAMGLMQLMPGTARYVGVADAFDPRQNIFGGAKLLRILTNQYNGDINLLLSAYNAGRGAVARYDGIPYEATRNYVRRVYQHYKRYQQVENGE